MSGKFMKIKKIFIPTITAVIIASQLFGCASVKQSELLKMINNDQQIEIEVIEPDFKEQGTHKTIIWDRLACLSTYAETRNKFDELFGVSVDGSYKNGSMYINYDGKQDSNTTLQMALSNKKFVDTWLEDEKQEQTQQLSSDTYADVDTDSIDATYAIINAYWNLLPDNETNYYNGGSPLTRAEAMALVMRAITPVTDSGKPDSNKEFTDAVSGDSSEYTDYANAVNKNAYINTSDKSLNSSTFTGNMTKGEYIYLVMNTIFGSDAINKADTSVELSDCKDGGDIAKAQEFDGKDFCKSYELVYAIQNADKGCPTEMYKAICLAKEINIISSETNWDAAITKTEAIELFVGAQIAYSEKNGFAIEAESGVDNLSEYASIIKNYYTNNKDSINCDEKTFTDEVNYTIKHGGTYLYALESAHQLHIKNNNTKKEDTTKEDTTEDTTKEDTTKKDTTTKEHSVDDYTREEYEKKKSEPTAFPGEYDAGSIASIIDTFGMDAYYDMNDLQREIYNEYLKDQEIVAKQVAELEAAEEKERERQESIEKGDDDEDNYNPVKYLTDVEISDPYSCTDVDLTELHIKME